MIAAHAGALRRRLLMLVVLVLVQPTHALRGRRLLQGPAVTFEPPPPPATYSPTTSPTAAPVFLVTAELELLDSELEDGLVLDAALLISLRTFLAQYTGLAYDEVLTHSLPPSLLAGAYNGLLCHATMWRR
jgi:hypothetical protein